MNEKDVLKRFRQKKILTIEQLVSLLQFSLITARRRLKKWKCYTSFNKNGRYYTLPDIPEFDKNGIWKYQTILFSKYGNLKQTVIHIIEQSKTGLSAREISKIVDLPSNSSFFSQLQNLTGIRREKYQGRFIYFSEDPALYGKQRHELTSYQEVAVKFISDSEAVVILVHFIRHPNISIEELSDKVTQQGKKIKPSLIKYFLESHDLLKKIPVIK